MEALESGQPVNVTAGNAVEGGQGVARTCAGADRREPTEVNEVARMESVQLASVP
jgi:hypothetical protein